MADDTAYALVRRAGDADRRVVTEVLTEALMADPLTCWLFPVAAERGRLQALFHGHLLASAGSEAYLTGREGASVWLTEDQELDGGDTEGSVFGENGARLRALGKALAERHPRHGPHLYLACMGVVGGRQGGGLGTAMLRHRLTRADADGLGAYLEASSPRSRALYLRHGFEDLGEPVRVAGSPLVWPMWRRPTQGGTR